MDYVHKQVAHIILQAQRRLTHITVRLRAVGDAPRLEHSRVSLPKTAVVSDLKLVLSRALGTTRSPGLQLFLGNGFLPSQQQSLQELKELFASPRGLQSDGLLTFAYSSNEVWG
jgi:hypothetical protein